MECVYPSARSVAPEDLRRGVYVALQSVIEEESPVVHVGDGAVEPPRLIRYEYLPPSAAPMRVVAVSLPYVLVKLPSGDHWTLDVRRYRLSVLPVRYGRLAFAKLNDEKKPAGKAKKEGGKKRRG